MSAQFPTATLEDLRKIDSHLKDNSYIEGYSYSESDAKVYKSLLNTKITNELVHLTRWFNHLSILDGKLAVQVENPEKTEKQKEKEAKRLEKLKKFKEKQEKQKDAPKKDSVKKDVKSSLKKSVFTYTGSTKPGEKKDITIPIPDSYSPEYVEAAWYDWWEKEGVFKPENSKNFQRASSDNLFVMVIPPPNVTGSLHLGHALTNSVEDALARWNRMRGKTTLWVPGCDHAGIATQVVVEKQLYKEQKLTRHDLGREKFTEKVWEWKKVKGDTIYHQLRKLGSSLDWERACFTMDPKMCEAVTEAFICLHEDGDIYRSTRLVNWSCTLKSAISDIEVEKKEVSGPTLVSVPGYKNKVEVGVLIHFAYLVEGSSDKLIVATTRIETMLGDTAVAVHPNDSRYIHLHNRSVVHPFDGRRLPIVCDEFVDMEFGTGAVKITPAHDQNDYEVGKRHNLPFITIFDDDGNVCCDYEPFKNMKRFDARVKVLELLTEKGLFVSKKDNPMVVPICSRSKDIVEPLLKPQWYVKCDKMASDAVDVVKNGQLKIVPELHIKTWNKWMENIRDWCISRQLWWGHQIPAYFITINDPSIPSGDKADNNYWVAARNEEEAIKKGAIKFKTSPSKVVVTRDPDVLDTWFSSALFPFSVFGWPHKTDDLKRFFPGTLLETGHDILFFWVARMVFFSRRLTGQLPFRTVYLHSMVRDAHGRKMSKSLGNVIDPLHVINGVTLEELHKTLETSNLDSKEVARARDGQKKDYPNGIPECGTDALRFALCSYISQGRDINLDVLRVQGYRFFCNKLWNAAKFSFQFLGDQFKPQDCYTLSPTELPINRWILSRLSHAVEVCNTGFELFDFPRVTSACHNFWLYELCDVYLECIKPVVGMEVSLLNSCQQVLYVCLHVGLRLIAPLMPFISEELYQRLNKLAGVTCPSIAVESYPGAEVCWKDELLQTQFEMANQVIKAIRSLRSEYNIVNKTKIDLFLEASDQEVAVSLSKFTSEIQTLSYSGMVSLNVTPPDGCAILAVSDKCVAHLVLKGIIDVEKEIIKLENKVEKCTLQLAKLKASTEVEGYVTKVPEEVRIATEDKILQSTGEISKLNDAISALKRVKL